MEVVINGITYKVTINYREGFVEEEVINRMTDYFEGYDYVFGDWAYGKLRLKGFYKSDNKKVTKINDIKDLDKYINENCAYDCKHFLLEKVK